MSRVRLSVEELEDAPEQLQKCYPKQLETHTDHLVVP